MVIPPSRFPRKPRSTPGKTPTESPGDTLTLPQLLDLVERACRGDKALSRQLFTAFMQMRLRPNTPANERALADVLIRILIGEREPSLATLETEDIQPVRDLLQRLMAKAP